MHILVTGGCGYVGSVLIPKLLAKEHIVGVFDLQWFGNRLAPHPALECFKEDFREIQELCDVDAIIHLAGIANDPHGDLDPKLTWEVNALGTAQLAALAARDGVKQFIYASSGSVYGVTDAPKVTEDLPLVPITEYNKTKMVAERVLLSYAEQMSVQIVRPATVCGTSPRQRLDVVVNRHTMQALALKRITVFGGAQMRPHIHIQDMADLYCWLIERPSIAGIFNAGFEEYTVDATATAIAIACNAEVEYKPTTDPRSYRMDSSKLLAAGFKPLYTVAEAIADLRAKYADGLLKDEPICHNIDWMRRGE